MNWNLGNRRLTPLPVHMKYNLQNNYGFINGIKKRKNKTNIKHVHLLLKNNLIKTRTIYQN